MFSAQEKRAHRCVTDNNEQRALVLCGGTQVLEVIAIRSVVPARHFEAVFAGQR